MNDATDHSSVSFGALTGRLTPYLTSDKTFTLPAVDLDAVSPELKATIARLPYKTLDLVKAEIVPKDEQGNWVLTGIPTQPWPVPGFEKLFVEVAGAVVTLTISDMGAESSIVLTLDGDMNVGTAQPVALSISLASGGSDMMVGTPQHPIPLDNILAHMRAGAPAWTGLRSLLPSGIDFGLIGVTLKADYDALDAAKPPVMGGKIEGTVTLRGKVTMQVEIAFAPEKETEPSITMSWPVEGKDAPDCTINDVLGGMGLHFSLPGPLNRPLGSFAMSYVYVDEGSRLNPNDSRRLVFSMPNQAVPDFRICWANDATNNVCILARGFWEEVALPKLPLVGDHLQIGCRPLALLLTTHTMSIKDVAELTELTELPEMLDKTEEESAKENFTAGIHYMGFIEFPLDQDPLPPGMDVGFKTIPFHVPLYTLAETPSPPSAPPAEERKPESDDPHAEDPHPGSPHEEHDPDDGDEHEHEPDPHEHEPHEAAPDADDEEHQGGSAAHAQKPDPHVSSPDTGDEHKPDDDGSHARDEHDHQDHDSHASSASGDEHRTDGDGAHGQEHDPNASSASSGDDHKPDDDGAHARERVPHAGSHDPGDETEPEEHDEPAGSAHGDEEEQPGHDPALTAADKTSAVPVQKNFGPVHLGSIGFRFEEDSISLLFDISLQTGGLTFELLGLRAGIRLKDHSPIVGIDGFILSFNSGEVSLTGGFKVDTSGKTNDYIGTVLVRVGDAFAIEALGAFSDGNPPKMFLFGASKEQLGGPPWLFITGLAGGLGYNRAFKVPAVEHVNDFPFVMIANNLARGGEAPAAHDSEAVWKVLANVETYLGPSDGTDFLTAGFTATSFGLIDSTVLAAIVFGSTVEFAILGSSSVDMPKGAPIAHADIEVVASVQPDAGLIAIDGLLAPTSYVLSRDCHLTGGFASHSWVAGSHAGDFVFTLGGYSPKYKKPDHYPAVPRLGYVWKVSDEVLITGWSYFALTPSSVQAGGGLSIVLDAGPLSAWCHATADFFVEWKPFHYDISVSVEIGVSLHVDMLFCSVTLTAHVSADLAIWGPEFTGHADVDVTFTSFGVNFGAHAPRGAQQQGWDTSTFLSDMVVPVAKPHPTLRAGPHAMASHAPLLRAAAPTQTQPVQIVAVQGLSDAAAGAHVDWIGDPAHTVINILTALPAINAKLKLNDGAKETDSDVPTGVPPITLQARPIKGAPTIDPVLTVTITSQESVDMWRASSNIGQVPSALYNDSSPTDLTPALTGVHLDILPIRPDETLPVEQRVLLFHDVKDVPLLWQKPGAPAAGSFTWANDNPFKTIKAVADKRTALLGEMATLGYVDRSTISAINVDFIVPAEPCFMADPVLCRLGAEQFS